MNHDYIDAEAILSTGASRDMLPLRVTWTLDTAIVVPERAIHLDALLAHAQYSRAMRSGGTPTEALDASEDLPLLRIGTAKEWVWSASALAITAADTPFVTHFIRSVDIDDMARARSSGILVTNKNTFPAGTGAFRSYFVRQIHQQVKRVEAFAVGHVPQVRELLSEIRYLGKQRRNGWGRVRSCEVNSDEAGATRWTERALPKSLGDLAGPAHFPATGTVRPPYFDRRAWTEMLEFAGAVEA